MFFLIIGILSFTKVIKKYYEDPEARRKHSIAHQKDTTPFNILTKDGTVIKTFTYLYDAREYLQKEYGIKTRIKIGEVLRGKRKSSHGFVFKYVE